MINAHFQPAIAALKANNIRYETLVNAKDDSIMRIEVCEVGLLVSKKAEELSKILPGYNIIPIPNAERVYII